MTFILTNVTDELKYVKCICKDGMSSYQYNVTVKSKNMPIIVYEHQNVEINCAFIDRLKCQASEFKYTIESDHEGLFFRDDLSFVLIDVNRKLTYATCVCPGYNISISYSFDVRPVKSSVVVVQMIIIICQCIVILALIVGLWYSLMSKNGRVSYKKTTVKLNNECLYSGHLSA